MTAPAESKPHSVNGLMVRNRITMSMSNEMPDWRVSIVRAMKAAHIFATSMPLESNALTSQKDSRVIDREALEGFNQV